VERRSKRTMKERRQDRRGLRKPSQSFAKSYRPELFVAVSPFERLLFRCTEGDGRRRGFDNNRMDNPAQTPKSAPPVVKISCSRLAFADSVERHDLGGDCGSRKAIHTGDFFVAHEAVAEMEQPPALATLNIDLPAGDEFEGWCRR